MTRLTRLATRQQTEQLPAESQQHAHHPAGQREEAWRGTDFWLPVGGPPRTRNVGHHTTIVVDAQVPVDTAAARHRLAGRPRKGGPNRGPAARGAQGHRGGYGVPAVSDIPLGAIVRESTSKSRRPRQLRRQQSIALAGPSAELHSRLPSLRGGDPGSPLAMSNTGFDHAHSDSSAGDGPAGPRPLHRSGTGYIKTLGKHTKWTEQRCVSRLSPTKQELDKARERREAVASDALVAAEQEALSVRISRNQLLASVERLYGSPQQKPPPPRSRLWDDPFFFDLRVPATASGAEYDSHGDPHLRAYWRTRRRMDRRKGHRGSPAPDAPQEQASPQSDRSRKSERTAPRASPPGRPPRHNGPAGPHRAAAAAPPAHLPPLATPPAAPRGVVVRGGLGEDTVPPAAQRHSLRTVAGGMPLPDDSTASAAGSPATGRPDPSSVTGSSDGGRSAPAGGSERSGRSSSPRSSRSGGSPSPRSRSNSSGSSRRSASSPSGSSKGGSDGGG
eukprot:TRINITY_DN12455_c0_g1_i1.p1 TRINITY_DN12455_c0_g1~~TRINITY_DN12455_c0_g1_i1.p1  ORF type:complete len:542 (+),score=116.10 TRINITY_DN12455_c0_g1_i1:123-1628(+)